MRLQAELPFMATESMIMAMVEKEGSRQEAHEAIRVLSHEAGAVVKQEGKPNDLVERVRQDDYFKPIWDDLTPEKLLNPANFVGRAPQQVQEFVEAVVEPALAPYKDQMEGVTATEIKV
ncbi:Adenylosuccinate lyase [Cyphellophora attinorum]|uniref:Adenylosuccinate lyase n=1 Tax=Cyphellophora attinorum TaxID=1664694 RepID=A0A0N1H8F2_9EURO|nr:Adenylosuccinate lyase [Phialophora attinorum]KPI39376.1 Adenylosuccinate lyase [Phialophora attinorum]